MRPLARLVSLIRADVPVAELEPFRRAGTDAYTLVDESPPGSWQRLAAWNAFMAQIYGDNLIAVTEATQYVPADTAVIVRQLYGLVTMWLERARQLEANPANTLAVTFPQPLPYWNTLQRSGEELKGMRATLEAARARVASDLRTFSGTPLARNLLEIRIVAIDSTIETIETLWIGRRSDELCSAISNSLRAGLDRANELGQLLAQPLLIERLSA